METTSTNLQNQESQHINDEELIGDYSKTYSLPVLPQNSNDLKYIAPKTIQEILEKKYQISYLIIDCRYVYEYEGGHIQGAVNIYREDLMNNFLNTTANDPSKPQILIFHCEFSINRAPNLVKYLRNKDRAMNVEIYPKLAYPEIYVLSGGYQKFFQQFPDYCEPKGYIPMESNGFEEERIQHHECKRKLKKNSRRHVNLNVLMQHIDIIKSEEVFKNGSFVNY